MENEQEKMDLPLALKLARVKAKLTQKDLAEKSDISIVVISQIENGKRTPSKKTLKKLRNVVDF